MKPATRPMKLSTLLAGIADVPSASDVTVCGLTLDSRAVERGGAFFALAGGARHGLEFASAALDAGASAIVFEPPGRAPSDAPAAIAVPGLRAKLGAIADRYYDSPTKAVQVIGVTGTNGKTSTVQLVAQALSRSGHVAGTIGTLGAGLVGAIEAGERTTPDVLTVHATIQAMRERGATHVAMEVSSHALEQGRVDAVAFKVAVFTNLTRDHLDYHGTMEAYGAAKAKLFAWPTLDAAVINIDDPFGRELAAALPAHVRKLTYSARGDADAALRASALASSAAGVTFNLDAPWGAARIASRLLGRFNVDNLLAVAGCLGALGLDGIRIASALAQLDPVPGRMSRLGGTASAPLVVVDYAHTPDALEQALNSLRPHTKGKLLCVFGCGGERDRGKRPQMAAIAERLADVVVITDDNPRGEDGDAIVAEIAAGLAHRDRARIERDRARAIALALADAHAGDTVLIAGKGHEPYQEIAGKKLPFDDLAVARAAMGGRA